MIQKLTNGKGAVARFGRGTVRIRPYAMVTRFGGQLELTTCHQQAVGTSPVSKKLVVDGTNKIVLDFESMASLDQLIEKLNDLRDLIKEEHGVANVKT